MKSFPEKNVINAIRDDKIKYGLEKYEIIMKEYRSNINVSKEKEFQKKFKGFYRLRRNESFCKEYFSFLQNNRRNRPIFTDTLTFFYRKFNKVEISFISKLFATIDENLPIYDRNVIKSLGIKKHDSALCGDAKIQKAGEIYNELIQWYTKFINTDEGKLWGKLFDMQYPQNNISSVKKIDFILWKLGSGK